MSSSTSIPTTMQACQLSKYIQSSFSELAEGSSVEDALKEYISVEDVEVPKPRKGEVLVKIARSPINPSDLSSLKGSYDASGKPNLPFRPGFEGSGLVVASGGGMLGWSLVGKRVAIVAGKTGGIWAQYATAPAAQCIALTDDISYDTAASSFVNPMTVLSFLEIARAGGHKYIVHTAAASALGKMLIKLGKEEGVQVIAVVRKDEQVEELKTLGAIDAFATSGDDWKEAFKLKCKELQCTLAFDAVAGPLTGEILHAMPKGSVVKVYGGLSEQLSTVSPGDLIFQNKKVEGFWLSEYIKTKSLVGLYLWQRKVKALLNTSLKTHVRATYTLDQVPAALQAYVTDMSAGKVLIAPGFLEEEGASSSGSSSSTTESEKKDKEKEGDEEKDTSTEETKEETPETAPETTPETKE